MKQHPGYHQIAVIGTHFYLDGGISNIHELGHGNINSTFLVTPAEPQKRFVLQKINTDVFHDPRLIIKNIRAITSHIGGSAHRQVLSDKRRWQLPGLLETDEGRDFFIDAEGSHWRAISFIGNAQSFDTIQDPCHARECGYALGIFHALLSDLPPETLADTLIGFHVTPAYLGQYDNVLAKHSVRSLPEIDYCRAFIEHRRSFASVLEDAKEQGKLPLRCVHGDPKINNIMIDNDSLQAVSIVDLDTVKPGLVHYDIGDCLRSGCNPAGEETENWEAVEFDTDMCRAILQGYLAKAGEFLTQHDSAYIYDAIRLLAFELGLRFFSDYLAGNVYFRVDSPDHNLRRALVQFKLVESIETREKIIRRIVKEFT